MMMSVTEFSLIHHHIAMHDSCSAGQMPCLSHIDLHCALRPHCQAAGQPELRLQRCDLGGHHRLDFYLGNKCLRAL